jgi:hypothetical protein
MHPAAEGYEVLSWGSTSGRGFLQPSVPDPEELPHEVLHCLYNSCYREVDRFATIAVELFGPLPGGWSLVQSACDRVHSRASFGYEMGDFGPIVAHWNDGLIFGVEASILTSVDDLPLPYLPGKDGLLAAFKKVAFRAGPEAIS